MSHWQRMALLALVVSLVLLSGARILKSRQHASDLDVATSEEDRTRIRHFWDVHRQAGQARVAGNRAEAIARYREALAIDQNHEDARYYLANLLIEESRFTEAAMVLDSLVLAHPTSSRGHSRRGDLSFCFPESGLMNLDEAEVHYRRAVQVNKEETGPLLRLAQLALVRRDFPEASRHLANILKTNTGSLEALYLQGVVAWIDGRAEDAREHFTATVKPAPEKDVKVIGEGDRKNAGAVRPGEQMTCPGMNLLLRDLFAPAAGLDYRTSFQGAVRTLDNLSAAAR